jgi:hypothetical protein
METPAVLAGDYVQALGPARSRAAAWPHSAVTLRSEATCDDDEVDGYDEIMSSLAEQFICADERSSSGATDSSDQGSGHRSRRRLEGPARDNRSDNGRRAGRGTRRQQGVSAPSSAAG